MPDSKEKTSGREQVKKSQVTGGVRDDERKTQVPADQPSVSEHPGGDSDVPVLDPTNPDSKPYGTTRDQVANMEGEGQAQTPGQEQPAGINEKAGKGREKGERH